MVIWRTQHDGEKLASSEFVVNHEHAGDRAPTWSNFAGAAFVRWRKILI
jgi:hypothetical protein